MAGQRRRESGSRWLIQASTFVIVGSLSVAGGFELRTNLLAGDGVNPAAQPAVTDPSGSAGVGERSAPERTPDSVAPGLEPTPTTSPSPTASRSERAKPDPRVAYESAVIKLTNAERADAGCDALRADSRLRTAAREHSTDMGENGYFAHDSPDGTTPWDRAADAGYSNPSAENIAHGYTTAKAVVAAWMASPGHRANILDCRSKAVGVGIYLGGDGGPYWTQLFGYT